MNKKVLFINPIVAVLFSLLLVSCDKESIIPSADLPSEISAFITTHFPNNTVIQVTKDRDGLIKTYDILLTENVSLEFNRKNEIIDIDCNSQLPNSAIPAKILDYVQVNYPNNFITDWELDDRNQLIRLNNGVDLEFNMKGDFIRIDN